MWIMEGHQWPSRWRFQQGPMAPFGYQVEYQDTKNKTQIWKHFLSKHKKKMVKCWGMKCWGQYFLNLSNKKQHYQKVT